MHRSTHVIGMISILATIILVILLVITLVDPDLFRTMLCGDAAGTGCQ